MPDDNVTAAMAADAAPATGIRQSLKTRIVNIANRVLMVITLFGLGQWSFYGIFRCPFIVPYVQCQNCPVVTCHGRIFSVFWGFWGGLLVLAILMGRAFCGWLCPGGAVSRVLGFFSRFEFTKGGFCDKVLPWIKYLTLAVCLFLVFAMLQPRVNVPIRVGDPIMAVKQTFEFAEPVWIARTVLILALFALGILIPSAWCKFVCPCGGALELIKRFSIFRVFKTGKCDDCGKCQTACYMNTRPDETNCTDCGDCIGACPQDCIGLGRKPRP